MQALANHLSELKSEINCLFEPGAVITPHSDASSAGLDR
jgi:hypothetical protein